MYKKYPILALVLFSLAMLVTACNTQETIKEVIVTQEVTVEKEVIVTKEVTVEKEVVVTVEVEKEAKAIKKVIIALDQEPQILNPFIATQNTSGEVRSAIIEGLIETDAEGNYYPVLAKEVPTEENGGVQLENDVLTVTYHLLEGVLWSTGKPFTCDDVIFTWETVMNPNSGSTFTTNFANITSVECPDDYTAVVTYDPFYAPYLETFIDILPRHATGNPVDMQKWIYNWNPVGTGPFKMQEWVPGDHITLVKNENYRDYPEKPYLDKVIFRITPSREAGMVMLQTGEIDFLSSLSEAEIPEFQDKPGITLYLNPSRNTERLVLNLADPTLDGTDDPLNNPHPILGDVRVRKAVEAAINKEELIDVLLYGAASVGTKEYSQGWASEGCDIPASVFDPEAAKALLVEAGFTDADNDGIRECHGCLYVEEGTPLRLKLQTTSGNQMREQTEQLLLEYWTDVGIDGYLENVSPPEFFGTWASGAFRKHGNFDVLLYATGGGLDPHSFLDLYFGNSQMPIEANNGAGNNFSRWVNPVYDKLMAAGETPDMAQRKSLYCDVMKAIADELPHIYLYSDLAVRATREGLVGYMPNTWQYQTWNISEWDWVP